MRYRIKTDLNTWPVEEIEAQSTDDAATAVLQARYGGDTTIADIGRSETYGDLFYAGNKTSFAVRVQPITHEGAPTQAMLPIPP